MKCSIIVAARNERVNWPDTLKSIGYAAHEIIVVDDASEPGQEITCSSYLNKLLVNDCQLGVGASRERGASVATGDILVFTDAHMRFPEGWLQTLAYGLTTVGYRGLVCSTYESDLPFDRHWFNGTQIGGANFYHYAVRQLKGEKAFNVCDIQPIRAIHLGITAVPCVIGACYAMHRDFYQEIGGLQGLAGYGGDEQLLSWKVWLAGGTVAYLPNLVTTHIDQSYRKVKFALDDYLINKLYVERVIMGHACWEDFVEFMPWWSAPMVEAARHRPIPAFQTVRHPDEISEQFELQTISDAIQMARENEGAA